MCVCAGPRETLGSYFGEMGLPCPLDIDPADFFLSYLADPVAVWDTHLARMRLEDPDFTPLTVPPLTTEDMVLYFRATLHRGHWSILRPASLDSDSKADVRHDCCVMPCLCPQMWRERV